MSFIEYNHYYYNLNTVVKYVTSKDVENYYAIKLYFPTTDVGEESIYLSSNIRSTEEAQTAYHQTIKYFNIQI